jgi:drug/metabolite transporter (DMT)-like permease
MEFMDFIRFDYFITKEVMSWIYVFGAFLITAIGIVIMIWGSVLSGDTYKDSASAFIAGVLILIVGNLFWRIACEFVTVIFSIYDKLSKMVSEPEHKDLIK